MQFVPRAARLPKRLSFSLLVFVLTVGLFTGSLWGAEPGKRRFNLPADSAEKSLKAFSTQAGVEVLFPSDAAAGVRTNAVKGDFTPLEAARRMLAGTTLYFRDESNGVVRIARGTDPNGPDAVQAAPGDHTRNSQKKKMTDTPPTQAPMKRNTLLNALATALTLLITPAEAQTASPPNPSSAATGEETIELSPFTVTADTEEGWLATSSLAGSRLNTPLRDTAASISVLTSEFLSDIAAIDVQEALNYTVNAHFFVGEDAPNENWTLFNLDSNRVRIRGLDATVTRNYIRWNVQSDSYNADRIEENRGPNSILFGIGSAGGVLNTLTKQANLGRDFRRGTFMTGSYGTVRGTLDLNQRLMDGKLAVRLNAVHSHRGDYRHHVRADTRRLHLAATLQPRPRTRIRIDGEIGDFETVSARPSATDGVGTWIERGSPLYATVQTATLGALGVTRYNANQRRLTVIDNTGEVYNFQGENRSTGSTNAILDRNLADFTVNPAGPGTARDGKLQNISAFWEEKIGERTFVELAHTMQVQNFELHVGGQGRGENALLFADPRLFLPDGSPNPHAGEMFFEGGRMNRSTPRTTSHTSRVTISHELDFGKWGNYRVAAMGEYERRKEINRASVEVWEGSPFNSAPENDQNHVWRRHYVAPGDWSTYYVTRGPDVGFLQNIPDPTNPARTLSSTWVPFNQNSNRNALFDQRAMLLGVQARYLNNRLVLGLGIREDRLEAENTLSARDPVTNEWSVDHDGVTITNEDFRGSTRTLGAVGHLTRNLSVFYNFSNSLNLPNTQHRILPDSRIPPAADSQGHDFGVALSFFGGKLSARANAYTVNMIGATGGGLGGTATEVNERILTALVNNGLISQATRDERTFNANNGTIDKKLEGYEFHLSGALTKNWNVTANYSYTDGYTDEITPEIKAWSAESRPWFLQWPDVETGAEGGASGFMTIAEVVAEWDLTQQNAFRREGELIFGNRKHKFNIFTRYSFDRGPLIGVFAGVGYRYQGKAPTAFDANNGLQYSNSQGMVDGLLGYRLRGDAWFLKKGTRIQLNVGNLLDETDPRVIRYRPDNVSIQRIAITPPRDWRLTVNFEF
jgi:iron complex outermembrane receptor protein